MSRKKNTSLKNKVLLIVLANIIVCFVGFVISGEWSLQKRNNVMSASNAALFNNIRLEKEKTLEQDLSRETGIISLLIKRLGREQLNDLRSTADESGSAGAELQNNNSLVIRSVFTNLVQNFNISYLTIITDDYRVLYAVRGEKETKVPSADFESEAIKKLCLKASWDQGSASSMIALGKNLRFMVVNMVSDMNDRTIAYVCLVTHPIYLAKQCAAALDAIVGYEDLNGEFIFTDDTTDYDADTYKKMRKANSGTICNILYKGSVYLGLVSNITDANDSVCGRLWINKNYTDGYRSEQKIKMFQLLLPGGISCICILIIYLFLSKITDPLKHMARLFKDIAHGEGDLTKSITVKAHDEIGQSAFWFNTFIQQLSNMIFSFKKKMGTLNTYSKKLLDMSEELKTGSNMVTNSVENSREKSESLFKNMEVISDATKETEKTTESVFEQIQTINDFNKEVERNAAAAKDISTQTLLNIARAKDKLQLLISKTENINKIVDLITDIADQTILLGLNASIEASRAGVYGKGFSVIAGEVKELSLQAVNAAQSIKDNSEEIEASSTEAIGEMENAVLFSSKINGIVDAFSQSVRRQSGTLESIVSHIMQVSKKMQSLTVHVSEEFTMVRNITTDINHIDESTANVMNRSLQLKSSAEEIMSLAEVLKKQIEKFKVLEPDAASDLRDN